MDFLLKFKADAGDATKDISKVVEGLNKTEGAAAKITQQAAGAGVLGKGLGVVGAIFGGAAAAAFIVHQAKEVTEYAGRLQDLADKTGVAASRLQAFEAAGKPNGVALEQQTIALRELKKAMVEVASDPKSDLAATFRRQGVTLKDLKDLRPEEIYMKIAQSVYETQGSAQQTVDVIKLLGRSGEELVPAFKNGFGAAVDEAQRMGRVISDDVVAKLDAAGDSMQAFGDRMKVVTAYTLAPLIGGVGKLFNLLDSVAGKGFKFAGALAGGAGLGAALDIATKGDEASVKGGAKDSKGPLKTIDEAGLKKAAELQQKNAKSLADLALAQLTREEQITELTKQRAELVKQIAREQSPEKQQMLIGKDIEAASQLFKLRQGGKVDRPSSDALTRIGLRPQAEPQALKLAQDQLVQIKLVAQRVEALRLSVEKVL